MVTAEFTALVNRLLENYLNADEPDDLAELAERYQALPLGAVQQLWFFMHPEGKLLAFNWLVEEVTEFNDAWDIAYGLRIGSKDYPELETLLPKRIPGATDCATCAGSGRVGTNEDWYACNTCSGRGWLEPGLAELVSRLATELVAAGEDPVAATTAIRSFLEQGSLLGLSPTGLLNSFDSAMASAHFNRSQRELLYRLGWAIAEERFPGAWQPPEDDF